MDWIGKWIISTILLTVCWVGSTIIFKFFYWGWFLNSGSVTLKKSPINVRQRTAFYFEKEYTNLTIHEYNYLHWTSGPPTFLESIYLLLFEDSAIKWLKCNGSWNVAQASQIFNQINIELRQHSNHFMAFSATAN